MGWSCSGILGILSLGTFPSNPVLSEAWAWSAATASGYQGLGKSERKETGVSMYICTWRTGASLLLLLVLCGVGGCFSFWGIWWLASNWNKGFCLVALDNCLTTWKPAYMEVEIRKFYLYHCIKGQLHRQIPPSSNTAYVSENVFLPVYFWLKEAIQAESCLVWYNCD